MAWTDERVEVLKTMWLGGSSASQIAATLGDITRNAVIGKVHRLGLSGRGKPTTRMPSPTRSPRKEQHQAAARKPGSKKRSPKKKITPKPNQVASRAALRDEPLQAQLTDSPLYQSIMDVPDGCCRYIVDDEGRACGRPIEWARIASIPGNPPYCEAHALLVLRPDERARFAERIESQKEKKRTLRLTHQKKKNPPALLPAGG